jgi:hypothetical protein
MKKNAGGTGRSPEKIRPNGSENSGSESKSAAPAIASRPPKVSQTITKPVQPLTNRRTRIITPDIQASVLGPQLRS